MGRSQRALCFRWLLLLAALPAGCAVLNRPEFPSAGTRAQCEVLSVDAADASTQNAPVQANMAEPVTSCLLSSQCDPFAGIAELSVHSVVEQVLARNPSLAEMTAAWQAATARYPQVISLDDPMFAAGMAPASAGSNNVDFGYRVEVSQKFLFPGKRQTRGQAAAAEASAAANDLEDMRLQLIESATIAYYDYTLVLQALSVNAEAGRLLDESRQVAKERYENKVPGANQQDISQADVEIGRQKKRQLMLERMRQVAIARLNTLMHLPVDGHLPLAPQQLRVTGTLPPVEPLRAKALAQRPDLRALADRINAEQRMVAVAEKEYRPDVEVMAAYDTMMGNGPMRDLAGQVGVRVNLPVRNARRQGAVAEAEARLAMKQAELARQIDQATFQVQEAFEQVQESARAVSLYEDTILRAAKENVEAARSAYKAGKIPFLSLLEAQRSLVELRDQYYEALADFFRRKAILERDVGGSLEGPSPES